MKFFFKCSAFFIAVWLLTTVSDQLVFEPNHTLSASVLFGMTLAIILVVLFGGWYEVYVRQYTSV